MSKFSANAFFHACQIPGQVFLASKAPDKTEFDEALLSCPFALIGRCDLAEVILGDADVSWWHAYLQLLDGAAFLVDLGSESGVHVDGRTRGHGWLKPGHVFQIGKHLFQLDGSSQNGHLRDYNPLAAHSIASSATLEIVNNRGRRTTWPLNRRVTLVGKRLDCKVRLHSPGVAPFHCSLVATPDGLWVVDLCRRPGTLLNRNSVKFARLYDGDEIEIGLFRLYLHIPPPVPPAPSDCQEKEAPPPRAVCLPVPSAEPAPAAPAPSGMVPDMTALMSPLIPPAPLATAAPVINVPALTSDRERNFFEMLLVPVVNHFNVVQQQMFDQFHQSLMMFFELFGSLFKEQYDLIRNELDEVHRLTQELEALRKELSVRGGEPASAPAADTERSGAETLNGKPVLPTANGAGEASRESPLPVVATPEPPPRPDLEEQDAEPQDAEPPNGTPLLPASNGSDKEPTPPSPAANQAPEPTAQIEAKAPPSAPSSASDIHSWLCRRIDTVQQERRSRWQKILRFLMGGRRD